MSRETKFSGTNGDREILIFPVPADHKKDWKPYLVDAYSAISDDHTYCRESAGTVTVVLKVVPVTDAAFLGVTMDHFMCASHFLHPLYYYWYAVVMCDTESIERILKPRRQGMRYSTVPVDMNDAETVATVK